MRTAWESVDSYQAEFHALSFESGQSTRKHMTYSFVKPNQIRMDLMEPHEGTVIIYNPQESPEVKVKLGWWFPTLSYPLHHKRVTSDRGSTVDESHIGSWVENVCRELSDHDVSVHVEPDGLWIERESPWMKKWIRLSHGLPTEISVFSDSDELLEKSWVENLEINPNFKTERFVRFSSIPTR